MHEEITEFIQTAGRLKKVKRAGWISWVGIENPESVADHSYGSALIAMCIADLKGMDAEKLMRMLLLHDVHEALIGDYDYFAKKRMGKQEIKRREFEAINEVFKNLPGELRRRYISLWVEFEEQKTPEAKIARQIDSLEMVFQALEYEKEGYSKEKLDIFWENVEQKIEDEDLKKIFKFLTEKREASNG